MAAKILKKIGGCARNERFIFLNGKKLVLLRPPCKGEFEQTSRRLCK
jgi:hypothetical protein